MPKPKCCQLSGAKKRNLAKEKVDKTRSAIASALRLDRYIVHSKIKVTTPSQFESQRAATASEPSATITSKLQDHELSDSADGQQLQSPSSLAMLLHTEDLQSTFSNVEIAIRMYMSIMVSNCSGERSFSKMALIKNKLRSTMSDRRLSALELLSVENDVLECVSFSDIIEQFAAAKSRKRLWINSKHEPSYADMQHRNMMTVGVYRPII